MANVIEKVANLEFNPLFTLGVIEKDADLTEILFSEIKLPFSVLYKLERENMLSDSLKELLFEIFEGIILTKSSFVDKYLKLANESGVQIKEVVALELPKVEEVIEEPISVVSEVVEPIKVTVTKLKKEKTLPRRYGKESITKDIQEQGGIATPVQRAMLKVNDLKNIYVNLSARGIKDMLGGTELLSDEDCRKIVSVITIAERQLADILKKKK